MINLEQMIAGVKTQLVIESKNRFVLMTTVRLSVRKEIYDFYQDRLASKPGFLAQLQIANIFPQVSKKGKNYYLKVFYRRERPSALPIDYIRFYVDSCKRKTYKTLRYILEEEYKKQVTEQLNMDL